MFINMLWEDPEEGMMALIQYGVVALPFGIEMTSKDIIMLVFCFTFTFYYAWRKFNRWSLEDRSKYSLPPRSYTSFSRFIGPHLFYVFSYEALLVSLFLFPDLALIIESKLSANPTITSTIDGTEANQILSACFIITGVFPNIPIIKNIENKYRRRLQQIAQVPIQALCVIKQFESNNAPFRIDEQELLQSHEDLSKRIGINASNFQNTDEKLLSKLCKSHYIYRKIAEWETSHCYAPFLMNNPKLKNELEEKLENSINEVRRLHQATSPTTIPDTAIKKVTDKLQDTFMHAVTIISCGIFSTHKSQQQHLKCFHNIGMYPKLIPVKPVDISSYFITIFAIACSTGIPTLFYAIIASPHGEKITENHALLFSLMALAMHGVTILVVLIVHWIRSLFPSYYEEIGWREAEQNPTPAIVLGVLIGGTVGFLSLLGIYIADEAIHASWNNKHYLWLLAPANTGGFIAYYVHQSTHLKHSRMFYAGVQGLVAGISAFIISLFIHPSFERFLDNHSLLYIGLALLVGAVIGFIFPVNYRMLLTRTLDTTDRRELCLVEQTPLA